MTAEVRLVRKAERTAGPATAGMVREEAVATPGMWAGTARTEPGMVSGWHHHGDYESAIYVVSGALVMESGPGGRDVVEAGPGDYVYVPAGAVHRESNPTAEEAEIVVVRAGSGEPVFNVDGPDEPDV
jgi:uncharacterized RmlC-like cupin family protein